MYLDILQSGCLMFVLPPGDCTFYLPLGMFSQLWVPPENLKKCRFFEVYAIGTPKYDTLVILSPMATKISSTISKHHQTNIVRYYQNVTKMIQNGRILVSKMVQKSIEH